MDESAQADPESRERGLATASEVGWALRGVFREYERVHVEFARRMGLRSTDFAAVSHAISSEHGVGPAEISEQLGMSSGSATALVDRLEAAGHLHREPHPHDRRRVVLVPDPETVRRVFDLLLPLVDQLDDLASSFEPAEQEAIRQFLRGAESLIAAYADESRS